MAGFGGVTQDQINTALRNMTVSGFRGTGGGTGLGYRTPVPIFGGVPTVIPAVDAAAAIEQPPLNIQKSVTSPSIGATQPDGFTPVYGEGSDRGPNAPIQNALSQALNAAYLRNGRNISGRNDRALFGATGISRIAAGLRKGKGLSAFGSGNKTSGGTGSDSLF